MTMKKAVCRGVSILLLLGFALALPGCGVLKDAAKLSEYKIGDESAPSITSVVGEREVTAVESSTDNGISSKQYTYKSESVYDDLLLYMQKLRDDGWLVTEDIDLNVVPGSGQLGKNASAQGQILLISFAYEEGEYAIKFVRAEGTIS